MLKGYDRLLVFTAAWLLLASTTMADPLASWNEGPAKQSILDFVEAVTNEDSADFVPGPERIATFDNDGTLWSEQPVYFQLLYVIDRVKALAGEHPEWSRQEPFASLLKGDMQGVLASGKEGVAALLTVTHAGMTTEEFRATVDDWIRTARHPSTGNLLTEMVYQPMLELLTYLRDNEFKTFIVSGGGIDFMRPWTERVYGIPPEQVIGSSGGLTYENRNGNPVIVKLPEIVLNDDKGGKPVGIQRHIGRRPLAAFGNSDGDLQMLEWTAAGDGLRLCVYVHHTDAEREWAYDRESRIGRLDKGLIAAKEKQWTVVSMKSDWKTIYP